METIELSCGIYKAPECIARWYKNIQKKKNGELDMRNGNSKDFMQYIEQMEYLAIQALSNNIPFRLMTKSEWWL